MIPPRRGSLRTAESCPNKNTQDRCKIGDVQLGDSIGEEATISDHE